MLPLVIGGLREYEYKMYSEWNYVFEFDRQGYMWLNTWVPIGGVGHPH
jgi:hypothetical protein